MILTTLPNGFRVVLDHLPHVETVTVGVWCGVGTRNERPEINGISHMLEHCLFKGTTNRTLEDIINTAADIGGHMNAGTNHETTCYYLTCLSEHTMTALDLITDMVLNPVFPADEIERERGVVIQEIMMYGDQPDDVADTAARIVALPGQALGRYILGTVDTVSAIGPAELSAYFNELYTPDKMVLVLSGNLEGSQDAIIQQVYETFGKRTGSSKATTEPFTFASGEQRIEKDVNQISVTILFPTPGANSDDRHALRILASILGGGMSSRLFREVREKKGLCYGIGSYVDFSDDGGLFTISSGTEPELANDLILTTMEEVAKIATGRADDAELRRALAGTKSGIVSGLEKTMTRASLNAAYVLRTGDVFDIKAEIARYNAVTIDDVCRVAQKVFSSAPAIGLCGRLDGVADFTTIIGKLN